MRIISYPSETGMDTNINSLLYVSDENEIIIYQVFIRPFGDNNNHCICNGDIATNGCGKMADFTPEALGKIKELGATYIQYTGIIEHATQTGCRRHNISSDHPAVVKGETGSPYTIKDYYDVDPDLAGDVQGRMKKFENLVRRTYRTGLKVIIGFIPNRVARQYHSDAQPGGTTELGANDDSSQSFSPHNNFYYVPQTEFHARSDMKDGAAEPYRELPVEATGNSRFDTTLNITDWYETVKLNCGVDYQDDGTCRFSPTLDTWIKILDILLFWALKDTDGFRCDMAEMVPVKSQEWAVPQVKKAYPEILFVAEVYDPGECRNCLSRGKFDYLYDKIGLYDTLRNVACGYESASAITHCWQDLSGIEKKILNFLENRDERHIASDFSADNPRKGIPVPIVSARVNANSMMIYFNQEFKELGMDDKGFSGRDGRTTIFDYWNIDSIRRWHNGGKLDGEMLTEEYKHLYSIYQRVLTICNKEQAISKGVLFDLIYANINGRRFNEYEQYASMREYKNEILSFIINFDSQLVDVAINVPSYAFDFLQILQMESYQATDSMTGAKEEISLLPYRPTDVSVGGYSGEILKITF